MGTPMLAAMGGGSVFADAAIGTFGFQFVGFVAASILRTEVFYDCFGGLNFLGIALLAASSSSSSPPQSPGERTDLLFMAFTALFAVSRGWLLVFLVWRAHKRKGDSRFDDVVGNPPLFFVYWMVQACWVYLISMPLLMAAHEQSAATEEPPALQSWSPPLSLAAANWALLAGFAGGILLEISSDIQKAVWVEGGRRGGFCSVGWWRYSRHPNYAGEILQWWCAAGLAVVVGGGPSSGPSSYYRCGTALVSPLFTMHLLLNLTGTGVWNAEGRNLKRLYESDHRDAYVAYRDKTSPLIPLPPAAYGRLPMAARRLFFFEWERYEFKEGGDNQKKES